MKLYERGYLVGEISLRAHGDCLKLIEELIKIFLQEHRNTKYQYIVERLSDGRRIYLVRPTRRFNFDFEIWVESVGESDIRPSHDDIINDLVAKLKEDREKFRELMELIKEVYECKDPNDILGKRKIEFEIGESVEYLLKVLKWMFLLEDIYYWNYSRRQKLMDAILNNVYQRKLV